MSWQKLKPWWQIELELEFGVRSYISFQLMHGIELDELIKIDQTAKQWKRTRSKSRCTWRPADKPIKSARDNTLQKSFISTLLKHVQNDVATYKIMISYLPEISCHWLFTDPTGPTEITIQKSDSNLKKDKTTIPKVRHGHSTTQNARRNLIGEVRTPLPRRIDIMQPWTNAKFSNFGYGIP